MTSSWFGKEREPRDRLRYHYKADLSIDESDPQGLLVVKNEQAKGEVKDTKDVVVNVN